MRPDVCFIISHGFAARMIFHSNVIPALKARGLGTAVITANADHKTIQDLAGRYQVQLEKPPLLSAKRLYLYGQIRPYLYEDVRGNFALWSKHVRTIEEAKRSPRLLPKLQPRVYMAINKIVVRHPSLRRGVTRWEKIWLADSRAAQLMRRLNPGIVVSTYPVDPTEACLLLAAQRAAIPTVGQLLSWDNITSKGRFAVVPDYYVSWGPIMSAELREYYQIKPENIIETGPAHFDAHVTGVQPAQTRSVLQQLGLQPNKPYLFFGMSAPIFSPYEIELVEWLARAVEAACFGPDMQLVVRPHPQNVQGHMADTAWLPRLEALASSRVAIDYPILEHSGLPWDMNARDLPKLANLLAGCAVSLNVGSTLAIDAILHDKPVVLPLFDAGHNLPWWQGSGRSLGYIHIDKLVQRGGVRVARSFAEMAQAIQAYLQDPSLDRDGRAKTRNDETGPSDGCASERVADALAHYLQQSQRSRTGGSAMLHREC
jgi:hypothetical protein